MVSGHVFRVERKRGPVWYAKYRLPDGRQVQKRIGPAWTERGRPVAGIRHQARRGGVAAAGERLVPRLGRLLVPARRRRSPDWRRPTH